MATRTINPIVLGPQLARYYYSSSKCLSTTSFKSTDPKTLSKWSRTISCKCPNAGISHRRSLSSSSKDSIQSRLGALYSRSCLASRRAFSTAEDASLGGGNLLDGSFQLTWSKQRLFETTRPEQMKVIMGDLAIRLERQWNLLDQLHQLTTSLQKQSSPKDSNAAMVATRDNARIQMEQALETVNKNIHNLKVLHRDTQRTSAYFHETLPESNLSPLLQRQLGQACKEIYARHALTIESMAEIMIDLRRIVGIMTRLTEDKETGSSILEQSQELIMTFLKCRLMTQLLCDHVVDCMLHRERKPNGAISVEVNVQDLIVSAIVEARHLVEASFVGIVGEDLDDDDDEMDSVVEDPPEPPLVEVEMESLSSSSLPVTATLIRPWLQYALVELLKNSLAITMERNRRDNPHSPYWPIYVHVSETSTDITIQLMDQGGGFQRPLQSSSSQDWFQFASRPDKWDRLDDQQTYAMVRSPIRGLGVGLCLSRLHLRQFGGDLVLEDRPDLQEWTGSGASSSGVVLLQSGLTATLRLSKDMATLEAAIEPKSDEC